MSVSVPCAVCRQALTLYAHEIGTKVSCANCSVSFLLTEEIFESAMSSGKNDVDRDGAEKTPDAGAVDDFGRQNPKWRKVRGGLNSIFYGLLVIEAFVLLAVAVSFAGPVLGTRQIHHDARLAVYAVYAILGMVLLGALFFYVVGTTMNVGAPDRNAARLARAHLWCLGICLGLAAVQFVVDRTLHNDFARRLSGPSLFEKAPGIVGQVFSWAALAANVLFLRRIGQTFANRFLFTNCTGLVVAAVALGLVQILFTAWDGTREPFLFDPLRSSIAFAFYSACGGLALLGAVWFLVLVRLGVNTLDRAGHKPIS